MRRSRKWLLLFLALVLAAGTGLVIWVLTAPPPAPEQPPPPPPPVKRPRPPLQADALGYYVPGYEFSVGRFRFAGFTLRPEALVTFTQAVSGTKESAGCDEAVIRVDAIHLRCDYAQLGTVTIDGRFLTRVATTRLDVPVVSAVVTVRSPSGDVLYNARDSFVWHQPDQP